MTHEMITKCQERISSLERGKVVEAVVRGASAGVIGGIGLLTDSFPLRAIAAGFTGAAISRMGREHKKEKALQEQQEKISQLYGSDDSI